MMPYGDTDLCQHSGNGLFADDIKPLYLNQDILTSNEGDSVAFTGE